MDLYLGSIGAHVGGVIEVNLPYDPSVNFAVTLRCLKIDYTGSGDNRKRRERLAWQNSDLASTKTSGFNGDKTRLELLFDVPHNLPESQARSDSYHLWRLTVKAELPGADFNRRYELSVFANATGTTGLKALSSDSPTQLAANEKAIEEVLHIRQIPGGVAPHSPAFRRRAARLPGSLSAWFLTVRDIWRGHNRAYP